MLPKERASSRCFVRPSVCMSRRQSVRPYKRNEIFVGRYISLGRSAVHKNRNSALPNFGVINSFFINLHFELFPLAETFNIASFYVHRASDWIWGQLGHCQSHCCLYRKQYPLNTSLCSNGGIFVLFWL